LDVKDGIGLVALREYCLLLVKSQHLPAVTNGGEEYFGIEFTFFLDYADRLHATR